MKRLALIAVALGLLAGRRAPVTAVAVWQDGLEHADHVIASRQEFSLVGSGFDPSLPAKICLTGQVCVVTPVADDGSFSLVSVPWGLCCPGHYIIDVYQGVGADLPPLAYTGDLFVVDAQ